MTSTDKENSQKNDEIASTEVADELELNQPETEVTEDGSHIGGGAQKTEVANARKFALEAFIRELLTVKDSLEMALAVDQQSGLEASNHGVSEGLELILRQLESVFANFSVETVEPEVGDKLDPDQHQAMSVEESQNVPSNCVSKVIQKGYSLNNRLLRPAMVVVAKAPGKTVGKG